MASHDSQVVGFDVPTIERWLPTVTDVTPPIRWERLPGGHSNLTYLLTDAGGRELVIRRPPQGELLPKAHDMWREYRIIDGLWQTAVPVAEPIAYCDDRELCEAHFYVMGRLDGQALYERRRRRRRGSTDRHAVGAGESFVDVLAALHSIEPGRRRPRRTRPPRRLRRPPAEDLVRLVELIDPVRRPRRSARSTSCTNCCRPTCPSRGRRGSCTATTGRTTCCSPARRRHRRARLGDRHPRRPARRFRLLDQRMGRAGRRRRVRRRSADGTAGLPEPRRADRPLRRRHRRRPVAARLLPHVQLVQDGLHPARRVRPVPRRSEEHRGRRRRHAVRPHRAVARRRRAPSDEIDR